MTSLPTALLAFLFLAPTCASAAMAPPAPTTTFTATIIHAPGARIRSGPGTDMPVIDIEPVGRTETFDGWFQRQDDTPLPDEVTGQIEAWSRDWFHLANRQGWVASAAVKGAQPTDMPQQPWQRPAILPAPTANVLDTIPYAHQAHPVTCEIASLRMALLGRGIVIDEATLLQATGVDDRAAQVDGDGHITSWGNPNVTFVGNPDGHISAHTGYGVYSTPIARAAAKEGATVLATGTGIQPARIYDAVMAGHPAVAWVTSDFRRAPTATWQAWDGTTIPYAMNEHAVLVVGVTPSQVLVNDPMKGQAWHTKAEFEAAYATFNDMSVIIA